ncbi:MAG: valine--tRNA ligase, partial [Planctomycetota bacterium]|nr:valine--tRNA ligase [Planctomycetota bacterium]
MELPTRYTPAEHEGSIYSRWEESGCFQPKEDPTGANRRYCVMIPPPNVTGALHMGHALNGTVQDISVRFRRMRGFETLWIPGTDHAGIATQAVVEKRLYAEEGKTRESMGREAFLAEVWKWKDEYEARILNQIRRIGASCDWTRTKFTMEPALSRAVRESFCRLYERGLIYKGMRLVNWDCVLQTAISDDEIEYVSRKGKLWYLKYPIVGKEGEFLTVATTRPETMLGDTGVAVHPDDPRFGSLVGGKVLLPIVNREIPIIADESVDPEYGTGAVKVTPGHDPADYERGARHNLPIITILEKDGKINEEGGEFAGKSREEARKLIIERFEELGLLEKIEDIQHNVSLSDRSKSPVEPLVSEQWFVRMSELADPAIKAVETGRLKFHPERWSKTYLSWLEKVQDWCISRQLWWGHRIPVWYDEDGTPCASREDLEIGSLHPETGKPIVSQDPDVLDTWASSWLWPFATLGWPDKTEDLARFYPTHFLSTAQEIIYLWVARMVMAGYAFLDHLPEEERCPFEVCNIHATLLDAKGKRMSKSAGNGIDPIEMIDEFGADAVRLSLILLTKEGQDTRLAPDKIDQAWRFGNKVWNAARFVLMSMDGERTGGTSAEAERLEDRWILSRLSKTITAVTDDLDAYRFNDAAMEVYRFVWNDFCDWYLELVKARMSDESSSGAAARGTLARVLRDILGLLHPFTPYMTEVLTDALDEALGASSEGMLASGPWPEGEGIEVDDAAEHEMGLVQDVVRGVRQIRTLTQVGERTPLTAKIRTRGCEEDLRVLTEHGEAVRALGFLSECEVGLELARPEASAAVVAGACQIFVSLGEDVDLDALKEQLARRAEKLEGAMAGIDKKLGNQRFVDNADPAIVEAERERRAELVVELES